MRKLKFNHSLTIYIRPIVSSHDTGVSRWDATCPKNSNHNDFTNNALQRYDILLMQDKMSTTRRGMVFETQKQYDFIVF